MASIGLESAITSINSNSSAQAAAANKSNDELNQTDFIELLVAQVKNQDPSEPLDPSQFMNQLAQFSTVNGIQDLNDSFNSLSDKLSSDQSLQAANLVGRDVLIPSGHALLTSSGDIDGQLTLPDRASEVTLRISNEQGALVRTMTLGGHDEGVMQFKWDGFADDGSAAKAGSYNIVAEALINGNQQAVETELEIRVNSVTLNTDGAGTLLNLASGEIVPLSFIQQIK